MMTPEDQLRRYVERRDEAAFGAVVAHYTALVYALAARRCGQPEMAAEIAQDVFLICARKAPALTRAGAALGPWLHRVTLLETMNHIRREAARRRRLEAFEKEAVSPAESPSSPGSDELEHLDEAMERLSAAERAALLLRFYSGRSFPEMGATLGCSDEAARKVCSRALRKLAALLTRRGVALPASALAVTLPAHWSTLKAAAPPGLGARISAHVTRELGAAAAAGSAVSSPLAILSVMKVSTPALAASALVLLALPAGWYFLNPDTSAGHAESARARAFLTGPTAGNADKPAAKTTPASAPNDAAVSDAVGRLLALRPRPGTEDDYDTATRLERERIREGMRSWPAESVRAALDLLLEGTTTGHRSLITAESILDGVYAEKAPADATALGLTLLERDPLFLRAARWSAAEWFRTDPDGARRWLAEQDRAGLLESGGVEDTRRDVLREAEIVGIARADAAQAKTLLKEASPETAFRALSELISRGRGVLDTVDFPSLALAAPDADTAGRALGLRARSGAQPMWEAASAGTRLSAALPADLPPEVRQAALVEGSLFGGPRESLATLLHAVPAESLEPALEALSARLVRGGSVDPALLEDPLLAPWQDSVAAAVAVASRDSTDGNVAGGWAARISDPAVRARVESLIQNTHQF